MKQVDPQQIQMLFVMLGFMWKIDGEARLPEPDEIQMVIDKAKESLLDYNDGAQLEVGHLIIKKRSADLFDVFLHMGEDRNDNNN